MQELGSVAELREALAARPRPMGLVPLTFDLHEGHLSLVRRARTEDATVVVSLLTRARFPDSVGVEEVVARDPRRDRALLDAAGVDVLFHTDGYPPGAATWVHVHGLADRWEGARLPGQFAWTATEALRLCLAAQPDRVYMGEKDYQQLLVVRRMAADLLPHVAVVGCPTGREPDGLAVSASNDRLDADTRARAPSMHRALSRAQLLLAHGQRRSAALQAAMLAELQAAGGRPDYAVVVDPETLAPIPRVEQEARALIATGFGTVRLIDNAPLVAPSPESERRTGGE